MFPHQILKTVDHYTPHDWDVHRDTLDKITVKKNLASTALRQDSLQLGHEVVNRVEWKLQDTNLRLSDRINDVEHWYRNLERVLREVEKEIELLRDAKKNVERTLVTNVSYLEATKEMIRIRDQRTCVDLNDDQVQGNLSHELRHLDDICLQLRNRSQESWEELCRLKDIRDQLLRDMKDKSMTLNLDREMRHLTPESEDISFKPCPLDVPEGIVEVRQWLTFSMRNCTAGEQEAANGRKMTAKCWKTIRDTNNSLYQQREATQYAFRHRMHETQQARDGLAFQKQNLMDEIERMTRQVQKLEEHIRYLRNPLKLNHTRLETRKWRERMELAADHAYWGLREENAQIVKSRDVLEKELSDARTMLNELQEHLHEVEADLARKEIALSLDTQCMNHHTRPHPNPYQYQVPWLMDTSVFHTASVEHIPPYKLTPSAHLVPKESYRVTRSTMTQNPGDNERLLID